MRKLRVTCTYLALAVPTAAVAVYEVLRSSWGKTG